MSIPISQFIPPPPPPPDITFHFQCCHLCHSARPCPHQFAAFVIPEAINFPISIFLIMLSPLLLFSPLQISLSCSSFFNTQDLYWLNYNSNHWWEFNFFSNFQTPAGSEGQLQKQDTKNWSWRSHAGLPGALCYPSTIERWMGRVGELPDQQRWREDQGKYWQSLLFHSEWMELGHWWH